MSRRRRLHFSRRALLQGALAGTTAAAMQVKLAPGSTRQVLPSFASRWHDEPDRPWVGAEYWAGPLQDWRVRDGGAECFRAGPHRLLHLLTASVLPREGAWSMKVTLSNPAGTELAGALGGGAGFRIGIRGPLDDYRHAVLYGKGLDVGLRGDGRLCIGTTVGDAPLKLAGQKSVTLKFTAVSDGDVVRTSLLALGDDQQQLGIVERKDLAADDLTGMVALAANFTAAGPRGPRARRAAGDAAAPAPAPFRFEHWSLAGKNVEIVDERRFGPILFAQYTVSQGVLKLSVQMPPLGPEDDEQITLELQDGDKWGTIASAKIDPQSRVAVFRLEYNADVDRPYRLRYALRGRKESSPHEFTGIIRREPTDADVLTVADISCNTHTAFPNTAFVEQTRKVNPDFLAFVGDQFYESTAGYGVTTEPLEAATLDYLRKWYIHGWTWRELLRDRPSVSLPDDHDVYQGNIWGESGAAQAGTQEQGGYRMPAAWVNVVHHTQTAHHPDAHDKALVKQGITQYFGRLVYGGVDFAIIADRMYKSAPEGKVPATGSRGDHVVDLAFDPKTADIPGLQLLGPAQEAFLTAWADDWKNVAMKAVLSQTVFTAMATTHGGNREHLRADYDANGWPQTARHRAVALLRKAQAFHIAGDQHLPALIQYGIEQARDATFAFAGPAVNVGYPRWWEPATTTANPHADPAVLTGDFFDHFGNPLTVLAVANGAVKPRTGVIESLIDKASGLGIVRFDKKRREITVECWPLATDPTAPEAQQFPGWPQTLKIASRE
ncbi:MAG: hypothetical protein C0483_17960 [Pirellula sp.]|nr:hypothetical protein [Pirellula sp.]